MMESLIAFNRATADGVHTLFRRPLCGEIFSKPNR
jgi:hypothetical protein